MAVKLVVFDLAGTTVHDDHDVPRILQKSLEQYEVSITLDEAAAVMGIPKPTAIRQLIQKKGLKKDDETMDHIHRLFIEEMIRFYQHDASVREKDGVSNAFRQLKSAGVKIAVDTGFDRETTDPLLERMGWLKNGLIDLSVTSDEVPKGRPFPDMIFKAMGVLRVADVQQVAKVGDTASDMQQGTAAGCRWVIGVTTGAYTKEQLAREPHTHLVSHIEEILPILNVGQHKFSKI